VSMAYHDRFLYVQPGHRHTRYWQSRWWSDFRAIHTVASCYSAIQPPTNTMRFIGDRCRKATARHQEPNAAVFEVLQGVSSKRCDLPSTYRGTRYSDVTAALSFVNGYAYIWVATDEVYRVNLTTYVVDTFTNGYSVQQPPNGYTGVWGRWAYVPRAGCFVELRARRRASMSSVLPSAWGI